MSDVSPSPIRITEELRLISEKLLLIVKEWDVPSKDPPDPYWIKRFYRDHHLDTILEWLKVNIPGTYAEDLRKSLFDPLDNLNGLHFRSCQILAEDYAGQSKEVRWVQHAIRRAQDSLMNEARLEEKCHCTMKYEFLKKLYDELSDLAFDVKQGLADAADRLRDAITALKSKFTTSTPSNPKDETGKTIPLPPPKKRQGEWANLGEPPITEMKFTGFGPIEGTMGQFSRWTDKRTDWLKDRNAKGYVWIQTIDGRHYRIWFSSQKEYATCLEASRNDAKEREKTRNAKTSPKRASK